MTQQELNKIYRRLTWSDFYKDVYCKPVTNEILHDLVKPKVNNDNNGN